jgi:glycosyltransferase involved in cell wall biosynthesis
VADRTRVLLLIPRLNAGGAEQVMALLASGLSRSKYEVHMGLVTANGSGPRVLPKWVTVHTLGARRARTSAFPLIRLVWRLRPAVILSGAPEISFVALALRAFFPRNTGVLVRQNGTVSAALSFGRVLGYTGWLYRLLYRRADRIICQSHAMAVDLVQKLDIKSEKLAVLPNPVDLEGIANARDFEGVWNGPGPHLLAVGRLSHEKGFDLLIDAFAEVRKRHPGADLTIAGVGSEEQKLKKQSCGLGLESAVHFLGWVDKPYHLFTGATLFVLSSRYEGMPNALLEAAAAGLPLVATPASGGVVDLLRGRNGAWLAIDVSVSALTSALMAALEDLQPRQRFSYEFLPSVTKWERSHESGRESTQMGETWKGETRVIRD